MNANAVICAHQNPPCRMLWNKSELVCVVSWGHYRALGCSWSKGGFSQGDMGMWKEMCHPRHFLHQSQGRWWEKADGNSAFGPPGKNILYCQFCVSTCLSPLPRLSLLSGSWAIWGGMFWKVGLCLSKLRKFLLSVVLLWLEIFKV